MARETRASQWGALLAATLAACASPPPPGPAARPAVPVSPEAFRWIRDHATDTEPMVPRKGAWLFSHGALDSTLMRVTLPDGGVLWLANIRGEVCELLDVNADEYIAAHETRPEIRW